MLLKRLSALAVLAVAVLWSLPMLWVLLMSLKPNEVLRQGGPGVFLPYPLTLANYEALLRVSDTPRWLLNSFIVASCRTVLTLTLSSLAGYALSRIPFKGRPFVFTCLLAGMMVPGQAVILPLHFMFSSWNLHNTYTALIIPALASPFGVLLMTQFFKAIPRDIEEAAELDHAGRLRTFLFIMLPMSKPALTTLGIFTFLGAWNDFFWPLVSATDTKFYTITVGLASLQGNFAQSEGLGFLMATAIYASLPMIAIYVFFQHHIVRGVASGVATPVRAGRKILEGA